QPCCTKSGLQVFNAPLVRLVRAFGAHGRLGIVLQEGIRPSSVSQGLALSYDFQEIRVSRQKSFPEFLICFFPICGLAGLSPGNSSSIPIANPPDMCASPPVNHAVVLSCSRHSPSPV